jgi:hypothetical protein
MVAVGASLLVSEAAHARPERGGSRRPAAQRQRTAFRLFQGSSIASLEVNRAYCGITQDGQVCTDVTGSPVLGGGSWPRGTPDQYIFQTGVQVAGIIDPSAGFEWAGDTVGAWAVDTRGPGEHTQGLTGIYNSLNATDLANWPSAAVVRDTTIYNDALIGLSTISQQDTWLRYWDGNTTLLTGRNHTMGILFEQRSLAWNFPTGNQDLIYFVFRFTNITSSVRADYDGLSQFGYSAAEIDEIHQLGVAFQSASEAAFNVGIPDGGYRIDNIFAAFVADMDVADFNNNYGSAALPFNLGVAYMNTFQGAGFQFPIDIFRPPFETNAVGFVGVKYLKSPQDLGLTMFSTYTNPSAVNSPLPDPVNIFQGYRYLQGTNGPATGDNSCGIPSPQQRKLCFLAQQPSDVRFFEASGPFSLNPGESAVIVVAYLFGPTVAGTVTVGSDNPPGIPPAGDRLALGIDTLRVLDFAMGWVSHNDDDGDVVIEQDEVQVVPGSVLDKALVAQAVFDAKFLLPFAPDAPDFYLVPADGQVTVVWRPSATEDTSIVGGGDPYFQVASDVTNPLYDPNYRRYDVEGYRVWRGRSAATLELVAQFDYENTVLFDYTGQFFNADYGNQCAPELGVTATCPAEITDGDPSTGHAIALADLGLFQPGVVQVLEGNRVELADGSILITRADTAVSGAASGSFPSLQDGGVPFAYLDRDVRNGFRYFYSVTAFDVNSLFSGPSSLESAQITKSVTPRPSVQNELLASLSFGVFGDDDVELDPTASWTIDPNTGRFTGPPPPTGAANLAATFAPLVPALLPALTLEFRVDSVRTRAAADFSCPQENIQGLCGEVFVTFTRDATSQSFRVPVYQPIWEGFGEPTSSGAQLGAFAVSADTAASLRFGIPAGFAQFNAAVAATFNRYIINSAHENQLGRRTMGFFSPGGSRWFDGADETLDHPTIGIRVGHLTGVDTVWAPLSHIDNDPFTPARQFYPPFVSMQCRAYAMAMWARQADVQVTWGAGGTIATVRDVTHRLDVPFKQVPQSSYGFIGDANGNGKIDWRDFDLLEGVAQANATLGFCAGADPGAGNRALLVNQPVIMATSTDGSTDDETALATTGTGFGMYINGQAFIFELPGGTPPASGTTWTLRTYWGAVTATSGGDGASPSGYQYTGMRIRADGSTRFTGAPPAGTPAIAGLRVVFTVDSAPRLGAYTDEMLANVHTVPDPYYVTNALEISPNTKVLRFVNLPPQAIIRIYSTSGILVNVITHNDVSWGSQATWNLRNRNNQFVASGVYFYHVETPAGQTKVGRFTIVNLAQ